MVRALLMLMIICYLSPILCFAAEVQPEDVLECLTSSQAGVGSDFCCYGFLHFRGADVSGLLLEGKFKYA